MTDVMLFYQWKGLKYGYVLCHEICNLLPNLFHLPSNYNRWDCSNDCAFTLCSKLSCQKNKVNLKERD